MTDFLDDKYQIDTTKIFLGGNSAGSIMAIQTAYYSGNQINQVFPTVGSVTITDALGPVDIDNYYGEVSNEPDLRTVIKGVLNMWGQALFPKQSTLSSFWLNNPTIAPMIAFHGNQDGTLPITTSDVIFAPNQSPYTRYNSESNCLLVSPYTLDGNITGPNTVDLKGSGSYDIYNAFQTLNKSIELYVDCQMSHGLDDDCNVCAIGKSPDMNNNCIPCFNSDFGTGLLTQDDVFVYIVQRATTFFQTVLTNKNSNLHNNKFIECENKRIKSYPTSQLADNPSSCTITQCP